jgi:accessory colonization factor AcfC
MRSIALIATIFCLAAPVAQAAEIRVISPGVISNSGLKEVAEGL